MIFALIPAAGKSSRMGRPKLALPLGGKTVLHHVIAAFRSAGVEQILVVLGPHVPELAPLAEAAGAAVLLLQEETPDMRATVALGLHELDERVHPTEADAWLLAPADHPTLEPEIVRQLVDARSNNPSFSIFVPTFQGKRGHPTLLSWKHAVHIKTTSADSGLNAYLRDHPGETLELPVTSAEILCDLDTPEEYQLLQKRWGSLGQGSPRQVAERG
jgi:molybdenum cofactor cytidylyltransferase